MFIIILLRICFAERGCKIKPFLKTGEGRETVEAITYKELKQKVAVYASAMKRLGVQIGDRVVGMCTGEHNIERVFSWA